jgi:hypothetical protein
MKALMTIVRRLVAAMCVWACVAASPAAADEAKIAICHAGLVTLQSFAKHLKLLRASKRYNPEKIERLIARQRKGGPDFFSSQIVVQNEQSGSGTFDLRLFHGLSEAEKYRNVTAWACTYDDYPIVYFIGLRVRRIENGEIQVARERDIVNVISLKDLDPKLNKHLKVTVFETNKALCADLAEGCVDSIFYNRE